MGIFRRLILFHAQTGTKLEPLAILSLPRNPLTFCNSCSRWSPRAPWLLQVSPRAQWLLLSAGQVSDGNLEIAISKDRRGQQPPLLGSRPSCPLALQVRGSSRGFSGSPFGCTAKHSTALRSLRLIAWHVDQKRKRSNS